MDDFDSSDTRGNTEVKTGGRARRVRQRDFADQHLSGSILGGPPLLFISLTLAKIVPSTLLSNPCLSLNTPYQVREQDGVGRYESANFVAPLGIALLFVWAHVATPSKEY